MIFRVNKYKNLHSAVFLQLRAPISMERFVNLTTGNATYVGPSSLIQFTIDEPKMMLISPKYLIVQITFKRMFTHHIFSTFVPTLLLITLTQVTLFVDYEEHFDMVTMVPLTTMLVMYTLYDSISDNMPNTAYLKFIDIWLLYALVLPFITFVIEVFAKLIHYYQTSQTKQCPNASPDVRGTEEFRETCINGRLVMVKTTESQNIRKVHPECEPTDATINQTVEPTKAAHHFMRICRLIVPIMTVLFIVFYIIFGLIYFRT